jgi:hypothetical protein
LFWVEKTRTSVQPAGQGEEKRHGWPRGSKGNFRSHEHSKYAGSKIIGRSWFRGGLKPPGGLVHKNGQQAQKLINHLSKDFYVFVHIDKRSKIKIVGGNNVYIFLKILRLSGCSQIKQMKFFGYICF